MAYRRHRRHYRRHRRVARTRRMRSPEKSWLRWGAGKDLGKSTPHSLLAQLVDSKEGSDQAQAIIRKELLLARSLKSSIASAEAKTLLWYRHRKCWFNRNVSPTLSIVGGTGVKYGTTIPLQSKVQQSDFSSPRTNRNWNSTGFSYPPSPSLSGETKFPPLLEQYQQFSAPMPIPLRRQR